ncbi:MAG TPA: hypothetical protein QGF58_17110 [Myxococcota bacterium]|nr:hypothetical protein [Myxococcota bacterium]
MLPPPAIVDEAPVERLEFDLSVGLGFWAPTDRPALGAVIAFVSWSGLDAVGTVRFYETGPLTVYAGLEGFYNRSLLLEAVGEWVFGALSSEGDWDITAAHYGAAARLGASFAPDSAFQPGAFLLAGTDRLSLGIVYTEDSGTYAEAVYGETAMRLGGGVGADIVMGSGWLVGLEYRYHWARSFVTDTTVTLVDSEGDSIVVWEQQKWQVPPEGSSWALRFGRRF